jgi:two-component system alkaline phosphatase synthesis response regulator PhoP
VIHIALANTGYAVETFAEGKAFFAAIERGTPDLILLDIMLPDTDGLGILAKLKANPVLRQIPVMIISAKSAELDKVVGLDAGADDYMIKPFGVLELISRVKALLRRKEKPGDDIVVAAGIVINDSEHTCTCMGNDVQLTVKEFALLHLMMTNRNKALTRDAILNAVWGYDYLGETRTLDVHVKELRQKLAQAGLAVEVIQTVRGIGYKFAA